MATTLESKIRISAVVDQALAALRSVKKEIKELNDPPKVPPQPVPPAPPLPDPKPLKTAAKEAEDALRRARREATLLAPQITDIVTGLASGQSPLLVLIQQGGQLRDVFGGFGNALRAVTSIFTVARVAIGGVAAGLGLLAFAALRGRNEQDALNKSLALTGNIAGTSQGQLSELARSIAGTQNAAIGDVRETLAALVAAGGQTSATMASTGRAVIAFRQLTGASAEEALKQFDGQADGVAKWAQKANQSYNFLTATQFAYIRSLEAQGRTQEAMRVANEALADSLNQRAAPAVGTLERAWKALGNTLSSVFESLKAIGRDTTAEDRIAALRRELETVESGGGIGARGGRRQSTTSARAAALREQIANEERLLNTDKLRAAERSQALLAEQDKIKEATKQFQDSLASVELAGSQKLLAQQLAQLDAKQSAIELANAQGLASATQNALALNSIDQQRLQAQAAALQRQIALERAKTVGTPEESNARSAQVTQLEAQLVDVRSRIGRAQAAAIAVVAAAALTQARADADSWAQIWQRAFGQIRQLAAQNDTTLAGRIADPFERADAEVAVKLAALRSQVAELQRDLELRLSLTIDPGQRTALQQQLQQLGAEGARAIEETTRQARFDSLRQQFAELSESVSLQEQAIAVQVEAGALTTEQAEQRKFAARDAALKQLEAYRTALGALASTPAESNQVVQIGNQIDQLKVKTTELQLALNSGVRDQFKGLFTDLSTGSKTALQSFKDLFAGLARLVLDLIAQRYAAKIADSLFPKGGGASGGGDSGFGAVLGTFFASLFHTGGVVGRGGSGTRAVNPALFAFAPRYHTEGIVGLRPRERPIIALDGEEVLSENNPRHIRNIGGGALASLGGLQINTTVTGAQGSPSELRGAGDDLARVINAAIEGWAGRESRQGGKLAAGRA